MASRKVVMSHTAIIQFAFLLQQRISNSYHMAYDGKEQMLAKAEGDLECRHGDFR